MDVYLELSLVLMIATATSLVMRALKQPLIVGYIISGVIAGPLFLNIIKAEDTLELFSQLGITILLFIIGLHLNPKVIKEVGKVSLITGLGQIIFTTVFGLILGLLLGFSLIVSFFIAHA